MILTKAQANALYQAMCHLNDVEANFELSVQHESGDAITVKDDPDTWEVFVFLDANGERTLLETYESQPDFATAYGIEA